MSVKYKIGAGAIPHFITFSVVGLIDVFFRDTCKEIIVDKNSSAINYYTNAKGLLTIVEKAIGR